MSNNFPILDSNLCEKQSLKAYMVDPLTDRWGYKHAIVCAK